MSTSAIASDQAAINAIVTAFVDAWNVHDAQAYAALFTADGDFVNVMGIWLKGQLEIEQGHAQVFETFLSKSQLTVTDTQIRFLKPDVAILHSTWQLSGQDSPDGVHPLQNTGVLTAITVHQENTWKIAALHNTGTIPLSGFKLHSVH